MKTLSVYPRERGGEGAPHPELKDIGIAGAEQSISVSRGKQLMDLLNRSRLFMKEGKIQGVPSKGEGGRNHIYFTNSGLFFFLEKRKCPQDLKEKPA